MAVKLSYREYMRRKDGKAKYTIVSAVGIKTYRNENGEMIRKEYIYRRIVRNGGGNTENQ